MMNRIITRNIARGLVASPFQRERREVRVHSLSVSVASTQPLTLILSPPAGERQKACAAKLNTLAIIEVSFCRGS